MRDWEDSESDFARAFRYQYLITRDKMQLPGFKTTPVGDWSVMTGNGLPLCYLQDSKHRPLGVVLGIAVAPNGLLREKAQLPFDSADPDFFGQFEAFIVDVAGRYGFAMHVDGQTRFYTDPVGMIGAVHEVEHRRLAASPLLAIDRPVIPNPKFDTRIIEEHGGKYSLFHTADRDVKRLNPNCYLDLEDFTEHRFWPRDEFFSTETREHNAIYDEIARTTSFNMGEIASHFETALPLSGGNDSRLLAAMGGEHLPKIRQIFTHVVNYAGRVDSEVSDRFHDDFARWRKTLPDNALEKAIDFMFLEIHYNSSIGASFPAIWRNFYLSPFNSRRLIDLSLRFDDAFRRSGAPVQDLITRMNPALAAVPFGGELGRPPNLKSLAQGEGAPYKKAKARVRRTKDRLRRAG